MKTVSIDPRDDEPADTSLPHGVSLFATELGHEGNQLWVCRGTWLPWKDAYNWFWMEKAEWRE